MDFTVHCPFLLLTHIYQGREHAVARRIRGLLGAPASTALGDIIAPLESELSCFRRIVHMYFLCRSATNVSFKPLAAPSSFIRMNYIIPLPRGAPPATGL